MEPPHISEERRGDDGPGPADDAPRGGGKVHRIGQETRGLFEDFTAWVELRLRLVQLDVQGYIRQKIDEATLKIALVAAGLFSGLFALVTLGVVRRVAVRASRLGFSGGNRPAPGVDRPVVCASSPDGGRGRRAYAGIDFFGRRIKERQP